METEITANIVFKAHWKCDLCGYQNREAVIPMIIDDVAMRLCDIDEEIGLVFGTRSEVRCEKCFEWMPVKFCGDDTIRRKQRKKGMV